MNRSLSALVSWRGLCNHVYVRFVHKVLSFSFHSISTQVLFPFTQIFVYQFLGIETS